MLPVNHVVAGGVGPVHVAPQGGLRVVLVEHVIAAAVENGTVGIVHPVVSGEKMILRAERVGGELAAELRILVSEPRAEAGERGCRRELHECATRDGHCKRIVMR